MAQLHCVLPFLCKAKAVAETPAMTATAVHPLVFLPFHLAGHHLTARVFPKKAVTYPAHLALTIVQYLSEHYSAELPELAQYGAVLVPIVLSLVPYYYYRAFKHTTGPKWRVWAGLAMFVGALVTFKVLELLPGFPKDDPAEQALANQDVAHSYWHLFIHVMLLVNGLLVSACVPWNTEATLVPASPTHRTRKARGPLNWDCPPASPKQQGAFKAHRPSKATKAA